MSVPNQHPQLQNHTPVPRETLPPGRLYDPARPTIPRIIPPSKNTLDFINNFEARTPVVADLVKLVRYIYANTSRCKKFITTFIALNISQFDDGELGEVRRMFDYGGDIAVDIWEKARRNVGALDRKLKESEEKITELKREVRVSKKEKKRLGVASHRDEED